MKSSRVLIISLVLVSLTGCSGLPGLPALPQGATETPSVPPTPAASPLPTITPTPVPIVRVENGDHALFNGDFDLALAHFQAAYQDSSDPNIRSAAKWGEVRTLFQAERYTECVTAAQVLTDEFPDSPHVPEAYFIKGLALNALQSYLDAANAWQRYLELRPGTLDAYTQELRGDALRAAGSYSDALAAYNASLQAPRLGDTNLLNLKVGQTQADSGDYQGAIDTYNSILALTTNDYLKAQLAYLSGQAYQALGQSDAAYGQYRLAVEQYPLSYYAYLSLVELVDAQIAVSDLDRGIVDYYASQYDVALAALDRYLAATPINDGTPHYYRALTLRDLGNYQAAVDELSTFITNYSSHPKWTEAWDEKAYLQWRYLDQYEEAARTLTDYVAVFPGSSSSIGYLMTAGRILERGNLLDQAAATWQRVADEYPGSDQGSMAMFQAGIVHYRQRSFPSALDAFNRSLANALVPEDQARAYLWIGKTQQQLGSIDEMQKAWQQGQSLDPGGYYSERARDLMTNPNPFEPPAAFNMTYDSKAERATADTWLRITFNLPAETDLSGLDTLAQDPRLVRGTALWNLGLYDDARIEFEDLREAVGANAIDSYRLGNYLLDLGLYRSAIFALRQTLTLAGLNDQNESMMAPAYFSHARYGLYYSDLIIPYAQAEGLNPLFVFSVVRRESFFEGLRSTAGAGGLMQIMPATGASIAGDLGWPFGYKESDLFRPDVNIRFGTHYLASNLNMLGGDPFAALAAYNAGPGNAMTWKEMAGGDPDLFLEIIRDDLYSESQRYIRGIYEDYSVYRRLYGSN